MPFQTYIRLVPQVLLLVLLSACEPSNIDDSSSNAEYSYRTIEEIADEVLAATMDRHPSMRT
ncbi:MAG: hypothetical protein OSA80_06525, partial [Porticoccaceae bacterium]|nr:hypothetical protein [Porticoccaceae bacterium]